MARQVWKFTFVTSKMEASMPTGAEIIHTHEQFGAICLWAIVDPAADTETRRFLIYGTGWEMPDEPGTYIGTIHMHGSALVFHVFECTDLSGRTA